MKVFRSVYEVKKICHIQLQLISVLELWPFDFVCMLALCNLNSGTPHNLLIVQDVFLQFYLKVYEV